jgi:hypothetical protein
MRRMRASVHFTANANQRTQCQRVATDALTSPTHLAALAPVILLRRARTIARPHRRVRAHPLDAPRRARASRIGAFDARRDLQCDASRRRRRGRRLRRGCRRGGRRRAHGDGADGCEVFLSVRGARGWARAGVASRVGVCGQRRACASDDVRDMKRHIGIPTRLHKGAAMRERCARW